MEQNAKYIKMTTEPVERLITRLAVPTIISMLVTTFYNLADTLFVRQLENDSMVAAVGIIMPLMSIIQAFGFFCGHGSGNYISRAYGKQDLSSAEKMAAAGFGYAVSIGLVIMTMGLIFREPLVILLGAKTSAAIKASIDYMVYILIATPFMMGAIVLNNQLRMQGNAFFAMIGLTFGALLNIVLDPLLIFKAGDTLFGGAVAMPFGAGLGVAGAAIATCVSQIISFILLFIGMNKSDNVKIRLRNFKPSMYYVRGIVQGGLPSLARQGLSSIATACLNHSIGIFVAPAMIDATQAAMTGTTRIMMFLYSAVIGFGQGFQPVCGFNYGAKKHDRVIRAFWFCVRVSFFVLCIFTVGGYIFAEGITNAVAGSSKTAAKIAAFTFRAQLIVFPLMSWVTMCNMMLQTMGLTSRATIVAMLRQGIAFIPTVLLLPLIISTLGFDGLLGIQLTQTVADIISFAVSLPIGIGVIGKMKSQQGEIRTH